MLRLFRRPIPLVLALAVFSAIPVSTALFNAIQIPVGAYPEDSIHLAVAPVSWFVHALAGVAFGITGPVQFVGALRNRFGMLHRVSGRIFVSSGAILGLSGLSILAQVESQRTPVADIARGLFGLALLITLALAMKAVRNRNFAGHRAWMIRAYAVGMGLGAVALVFFPIYIVTGRAPTGLASDFLLVTSWVLSIAFSEVVVRHTSRSPERVSK